MFDLLGIYLLLFCDDFLFANIPFVCETSLDILLLAMIYCPESHYCNFAILLPAERSCFSIHTSKQLQYASMQCIYIIYMYRIQYTPRFDSKCSQSSQCCRDSKNKNHPQQTVELNISKLGNSGPCQVA